MPHKTASWLNMTDYIDHMLVIWIKNATYHVSRPNSTKHITGAATNFVQPLTTCLYLEKAVEEGERAGQVNMWTLHSIVTTYSK